MEEGRTEPGGETETGRIEESRLGGADDVDGTEKREAIGAGAGAEGAAGLERISERKSSAGGTEGGGAEGVVRSGTRGAEGATERGAVAEGAAGVGPAGAAELMRPSKSPNYKEKRREK